MVNELWGHQRAAVASGLVAVRAGRDRGLWVLPTGTGKTVAFAALARRLGGDALVLVHRDELLRQTGRAFGLAWPEASLTTLPGGGWDRGKVVVATVQSLGTRLGQVDPGRFDLVVVDEAHHAAAPLWRKVIGHFRPRLLLGCTATPVRLDGKDISAVFGGTLFAYGLADAMAGGFVVPVRQRAILTATSLAGVGSRQGDFVLTQLAQAVADRERTRAVVGGYLEHAVGRPALFFAADLAHVGQIRDELVRQGVAAAAVTGKMKAAERRRVLDEFAEGRLRALVGCEVLTEGYDERRVGCVVMARPTLSVALYTQCVGRGLRIHPGGGKGDCLVLDVVDVGAAKRPVVASRLFGAHVRDCGGGDIREAAEREKARWRLEPLSPTPGQQVRWESGEDAEWPYLPDLRGYTPSNRWQSAPATTKQLRALAGYGLEPNRPLTKGEAAHLLDQAAQLDGLYPTPATAKQQGCLSWRGAWRPGMSKREAQRAIVALQLGGRPR